MANQYTLKSADKKGKNVKLTLERTELDAYTKLPATLEFVLPLDLLTDILPDAPKAAKATAAPAAKQETSKPEEPKATEAPKAEVKTESTDSKKDSGKKNA